MMTKKPSKLEQSVFSYSYKSSVCIKVQFLQIYVKCNEFYNQNKMYLS